LLSALEHGVCALEHGVPASEVQCLFQSSGFADLHPLLTRCQYHPDSFRVSRGRVEATSVLLPRYIDHRVTGMQSREMAANAVNSAAAQYRLDGALPCSYLVLVVLIHLRQIACCAAHACSHQERQSSCTRHRVLVLHRIQALDSAALVSML
jgi:hypothetical protein